jgi:pyruvate/2-oxoglutarate dehydrogenase complex dihydrolipoamide dehydrogenase (E3) component
VAPRTIEVQLNDGGTRLLAGDQIVLNIGTHAALPDIPGLAAAGPLTHIEALELDYAPAHLVVLGGGYVGIEMAQAYRRFGSRVTVIEPGPRIISREDADAAVAVQRLLSDEGIEFLTSTQVLKVDG